MTEETQEKLNEMGQFKSYQRSSLIFWIIGLTILLLILWASLVKVDQVVRGNGTVIPASKIQVVQSVYGGVLDNIDVELSDHVSKGDILFKIDVEQATINYQMTKIEVEERKKKIKILEDLVLNGSEAEIMVINEKLLFSESRIRLIEYEKRYKNSEVRAPVDGIISQVHVSTIGEVTKPGGLLAEIVPDNEEFLIQAQIDPKDITKITIGQPTKIAFTSYDSAVYGMFEGKVKNIAENTSMTSEDRPSFYEVIVTVEKVKDGENFPIQSGMTAQISILGEKRTVMSFLLNPVKKLSQKAFRE
ncbi:HlyD family efflux transporter periplasmic adaptor subunit [Hyphomicrobiales bacterium]|nr:HlyD family efflux transporter periplasmic adaptor subunit [Hyphomicrobiales bacterium]